MKELPWNSTITTQISFYLQKISLYRIIYQIMQHTSQTQITNQEHSFLQKINQHQVTNENQSNQIENMSDSQSQECHSSSEAKHEQSKTKCFIDPFQYMDYCQHNKKIKIMNEQNPIFPNVYLKDISLHYKGPMQDKAYSKNYMYYLNIRRGNTLCQIYEKQGSQKFDLFFCRRGMKKFYDLEKQYLATGWEHKLTSQHLKYRRRIFQKIDQVDYQRSTLHLYSIFKENGEHCQVTFVRKLSSWLFASKNVSILVRNEDDLEKYYEKIRFYWAKLIAKEFLKMIKEMKSEQIEQLKDELETKTLLGEHCGYEEHQHITKYDKVQIIFYGIVQKAGQDHCLPVDYCRQFLKKFGFNMSRIKEIRGLRDKNSAYQSIHSLLRQTAEGTMNQYGQGSVLYVVQEKSNLQRTIAMCKLKTCEYLIFRRLREMLKLSVERKSTANTFEKFKFDIQNLIGHYFKPPKPLDFYLQVGRQAFKEANKDSDVDQNYLRYKFVQFMERVEKKGKHLEQSQSPKGKLDKKIIIVCLPRFSNKIQKYAKVDSIPLEYMYRNVPRKNQQKAEASLHILHMIPRIPEDAQTLQSLQIFLYEYDEKQISQIQEQIKSTKDLTKSHLITFVKSQDKRKSLQLLNQKIKALAQNLKSKNIKFTLIGKGIEDKDEEVIKCIETIKSQSSSSERPSQRKVLTEAISSQMLIVYPLLLPGSGKSTLAEEIQPLLIKQNIKFTKINCDQIRNKLMQKHLAEKGQQLNLEIQEANSTFADVKEALNHEYKNKIVESVELHRQNSKQKQVLFIDKVFGPDIITTELEFISQYKDVRPLILLPQSTELKLKNYTLPFSLEYLLICLKRCIERQEHSTMTRRPEEICKIFIWFLTMYADCSFSKLQTILPKIHPLIQFLRVKTIVQKQLPVHTSLKKKLQECLQCRENTGKMVELIEQMYKNGEDYLKDIYIEKDSKNQNDNLERIVSSFKKFLQIKQ